MFICGSEASFRFNERPVFQECDALGNTPEREDFDEHSEVPAYPSRERST